ncbi:stalk domain-containing protein [Paenibacillus beijingensis]|uniref:GH18 domain-containing protein n=1 Tax=Paenibacillus beijingensis TaxID=1126833 RepID=A0A0D5NNT7_9BACL|nr:stalk domain-containing protein [Paenibacillus beijingensis]AJY76936.1 hypothetical protein VN24_23200 [Paenibacillus beijingensis]
MKKYWKNTSMLILAGLLTFGGIGEGSASALNQPKPVSILLDDVPLPFDSEPRIEKGVTLVPFRAIAEALGINVTWNAANQTMRALGTDGSGHKIDVELRIGSKTAVVNGRKAALSGPPIFQGGRVLIPLAFFGKQFGAKVSWDGLNRTVVIASPLKKIELLAFYALSSFDQRSLIPQFNEVAFGWSRINDDGVWTTSGKEYKWPQPAGEITPESIVQNTAIGNTSPYLMVYSGDSKRELTKMLSDTSLRNASITSIVNTVQEKGFQGVVIDYEGLGWKEGAEEQKKLLNGYVKLLNDQLPKGVQLSIAVPPPNGAYKGYDYTSLSRIADKLILMAYEYVPDGPEPNDKVDEAVRMMLGLGVPKSKLILGVSVHSETENTITAKIGLAKRYGLKGVAFWRLGLLTAAEQKAISDSVVKLN